MALAHEANLRSHSSLLLLQRHRALPHALEEGAGGVIDGRDHLHSLRRLHAGDDLAVSGPHLHARHWAAALEDHLLLWAVLWSEKKSKQQKRLH